jgi:omega-6 fatty acid desaturase (delta-12 desaturase)
MTSTLLELEEAQKASARKWVPVLAKYRDPSLGRSLLELCVTVAAFLGFWALAWAALSVSPLLALPIAAETGSGWCACS